MLKMRGFLCGCNKIEHSIFAAFLKDAPSFVIFSEFSNKQKQIKTNWKRLFLLMIVNGNRMKNNS